MSEGAGGETSFLIREALQNGIVQDDRTPRDAPFMLNMSNAKATPFGAVSPERVTKPTGLGTLTYSWPFPQLMQQEGVTLLMGSQTISTVNRSTFVPTSQTVYNAATQASTLTPAAGGTWQVAAFRDLWFASNGESLVFKVPSASNNKVLGTNDLNVQALCGANGNTRLILGGLSGTWFSGSRWGVLLDTWRETLGVDAFGHKSMAFDEGWVVWGEQGGGDLAIPFHMLLVALGVFGDAEFDKFDIRIMQSIERGEIGMCPARDVGKIRAMKQLGERIAIYGANAISTLTPVGNRYRDEVERWTGIHGRSALNGTTRKHVWVDPEGRLYEWQLGEGIAVHNFTSRLVSASAEIVVSYDPTFGDFWISNGTYSYVWNGALGGPMDTKPSGMFRDSVQGLVGVGAGLDTTPVMDITVNVLGLNETGFKYLTLGQAFMENLTGVKARIIKRDGWRETFITMPWFQFHDSGTVPLHGDSVEFKLQMTGTVSGRDGRIQGIKLWYQGNDRRFRRGTTGVQETA